MDNKLDIDISFDYTIKFEISEFEQLHEVKGVYFIFDDTDTLVYIGKATDLKGRFVHHIGGNSLFEGIQKHFKTVKVRVINSHVRRDEYEKYLINKYKPPYNIQYRDDIEIVPSHLRKISKLQADKEYFRKRYQYVSKDYDELRKENIKLKSIINELSDTGFSINNNVFKEIGQHFEDDYINLYFDNKKESDFFRKFIKELIQRSEKLQNDYNSLKDNIRKLIE